MHCSHCGQSASGNFCAACGVRLSAAAVSMVPWQQEVRYEILLQTPEVRERIQRSAAAAMKRLSGEQFLELAEKAFEPLLYGLPVARLTVLVQPLYAKLGIGTGQSRSVTLPQSAGEVIVTVLCSLAAAGQTIKHVQQADDGCVITAEIPSDWRSLAGELVVAIHQQEIGTQVDAAAKIMGQLFDWGKSQGTLDVLFKELAANRAAA